MRRRSAWLALPILLLGAGGLAHADGGALCQSASPRVSAARGQLAAARDSLPARFELTDALIEANCYHEAVHTLEDGQAIHPRNAELQAKLRTTRSLASEQEYFAGKEEAELAAKVSRNLLRCRKLADVEACDEALKLRPNDAEILASRGDALLKAARPAEAELAFRRARELAPGDARIAAQLAGARQERQSLLAQCRNGNDDTAMRACQGALSKGGEDEFEIQSRLASLFQQRNQPGSALASYIAAQTLKPGDRGVALSVVALTDSGMRNDAVALAARGLALISLGRGHDAVAALRQAQVLVPEMPELRARLAQAQKIAAAEPPRLATAAPSPAPVEAPVLAARRYSNAAEPGRSH